MTLERVHGSTSPKDGVISPTGRPDATCVLAWSRPSDRMKRSHANTTDATEEGAYAVASLAVHALDGWRIIARTPTESGADIWMARPDDDPDGQVRLEVSGIAEGADAAAATRCARVSTAKSHSSEGARLPSQALPLWLASSWCAYWSRS